MFPLSNPLYALVQRKTRSGRWPLSALHFLVLLRLTVRMGKNCKRVIRTALPSCIRWASFLQPWEKVTYTDNRHPALTFGPGVGGQSKQLFWKAMPSDTGHRAAANTKR